MDEEYDASVKAERVPKARQAAVGEDQGSVWLAYATPLFRALDPRTIALTHTRVH